MKPFSTQSHRGQSTDFFHRVISSEDFCSVVLLIYVPRGERAILLGVVSQQMPWEKGYTCQLEMSASCEG